MIDIHCHILPGLDDGAKDIEVALEMAKIAYDTGIHTIIATPHFIPGELEPSKESIIAKVREMNKLVSGLGYKLTILPGEEVFISPDIVELLESGKILTLNDNGRYILLELPLSHIPMYTNDVIYRLRLKGVTPIIAHPERNIEISKNEAKAFEIVEAGALLQVNASSLRGVFGSKVKATGWSLLSKGIVHFVATDGHTNGQRRPLILVSEIPTPKLNILAETNPSKVINGCDDIQLVAVDAIKKGKRSGILDRFKRFLKPHHMEV